MFPKITLRTNEKVRKKFFLSLGKGNESFRMLFHFFVLNLQHTMLASQK